MELAQRVILAIVCVVYPAVGWAATIYVDPACANNGDGTATACAGAPAGAGPYNTWASVTFADGNTYAQNRGTTFTGQVTIAASGASATSRITMDAYGSGADPIIDGTGSQFGLYINGARSHITIQNYEVFGVNAGGSANRFLVRLCNGVGVECTDIVLANLTLHDPFDPGGIYEANGIWGYCADCTFDNLTIYNIPSDGVWLANVGTFEMRDSSIHDVATSGRVTGDCLQLGGSGTRIILTNNNFDHSSTEAKQAVLDQTTATSAYIVGNSFIMSTAQDQQSGAAVAFQAESTNSYIASNLFQGGWRAMAAAQNGNVIVGNLFTGAYSSLFLSASSGTTLTVAYNTFDGESAPNVIGLNASGTGTTITVTNNIFTNLATAISEGGTVTVADSTNLFYNNGDNDSGFTINANSILANPLFVSATDRRTQTISPARRSAVLKYPCVDARGRACYPDRPDIGAYQSSSGDPAAPRAARQ